MIENENSKRIVNPWLIRCELQIRTSALNNFGANPKEPAEILLQIKERMEQCKLELHPLKTKIVYCKDYRRKELHKEVQFDFLGFSFQKGSEGRIYNVFDLAISAGSQKKNTEEITRMKIHRDTTSTIEETADRLSSKLEGWINYYGRFRKWDFIRVFRRLTTD